MKKGLRKVQNRGAKGAKRMTVVAVSDPCFWQSILNRYRVAREWRFPTISFRSAGIRSVARTVNFTLSIVFRISPDERSGAGSSSIVAEKRSRLSFRGRPAELRKTASIPSLQPPPSRHKPPEQVATQMSRRPLPGQGLMTERTAGKRRIFRDRLKASGDIRVTAHAYLPVLFATKQRVQHPGSGKQEMQIGAKEFPYPTRAVLQNTISDAHGDGSRRRYRPGRIVPALDPGGSVQNAPLQTDGGSLHFHSFKKLEQEIDGIKKTIADTREALSAQSGRRWMPPGGTMTSAIDLNRLSDQVYRELERRIRAERERRGI